MSKKMTLILLITIILISISAPITANVFNWRVYQGDKINVFFPTGYEYQAQETFYYLNQYYDEIMDLTANQKEPEVNVVIQDVGLQTYGSAMPHIARINIYTNQPVTLDSFSPGYRDWFKLLGVHELTHIGHLIDDSNLAASFNHLTGNLFSTNLHSPLWLIEGIAIYGESYLGDEIGRLNDGYYDTLIASKIAADEFPSIEAATYSYQGQFPSGHWYLYGGTFFDYLAQEYGEEKFSEFFAEYADYYWAPLLANVFPAIGVDRAAKEVYGFSYPELFAQWQEYEQQRYSDWEVEGEFLVGATGGSIHGLTAAEDKLYFLQERELNYSLNSGRETLLVEYDIAKQEKRVLDTFSFGVSNTSLELNDDKLYYSQRTTIPGYSNLDYNGRGQINRLLTYDLNTARTQEIMQDEFKDFLILASGEIIYVKADKTGFGSEIWSYHNQERNKLFSVEQLISEIKLYQDELIVVSKEQGGSWNLNRLDLKQQELETIIASEAIIQQIEIINDQLYFSAYEQEQSIYQYDLISQNLFQLSANNYAKQGFLLDEQLYFITIGAEGEELYSKEPEFISTDLAEPKTNRTEIDFAALDIEADFIGWNNFSQLTKANLAAIPYVFPFGETTFGLRGQDVIGMNHYQLGFRDFEHFEIELESKLLAPLNFEVESAYLDGRKSELSLDYPMYYSLDYGLTELRADYDTTLSDDWQFDISNLNFNSTFNFKRPGLEELSLSYRSSFDHSNQEQRSRINSDLDFALWEQGLSRVSLTNRLNIWNDFDDHFIHRQASNLEFEFLLDSHQTVFTTKDIFNSDLQHGGLEYQYLRHNDNFELASEYTKDIKEEEDSFSVSIGYNYFDNLKQSWGITNNYSQSQSWNNDNYINSVTSSIDYERLIYNSHKLDLLAEIGFVEENDSSVNQHITYRAIADYQHRLLEVKKGFWNPNLFLADIYGEGSINYQGWIDLSESQRDSRLDYEYYLTAEFGLGMHLNLYPKVGFKVRNGELEPDYGIDIQSILNF